MSTQDSKASTSTNLEEENNTTKFYEIYYQQLLNPKEIKNIYVQFYDILKKAGI
jgi:hypothetical protein